MFHERHGVSTKETFHDVIHRFSNHGLWFDTCRVDSGAAFEFGPQIGFGADLTQTFALTVGDLARGVGYLTHGPASP